jgi:E3 SUMO-protein ligase PIAS1
MATASPSLLQQKAELAAQIKTLVNADLRDVCREESLQVSGVKSTLQNRIIGRMYSS